MIIHGYTDDGVCFQLCTTDSSHDDFYDDDDYNDQPGMTDGRTDTSFKARLQ